MTSQTMVTLNYDKLAKELDELSAFYGNEIAAQDFMIRARETNILEYRKFGTEGLTIEKELRAEIKILKNLDTLHKINAFIDRYIQQKGSQHAFLRT